MKKFILSLILALLMAGNVFAATISKSFTATGAGGDLLVKVGDSFTYSVSGTFVGTVVLQKSTNYFTWETVATATGSASGTIIASSDNANQVFYRFWCDAYTSGTIVTSMTDATGYVNPIDEWKNKNGETVAYTTETGLVVRDLTVTGTPTGVSTVSDSAFDTTWNGDTTTSPSKNTIFDKVQSMSSGFLSDDSTGSLGTLPTNTTFVKNYGTTGIASADADSSTGSATATFTATRSASAPATYITIDGVITTTTTSNSPRFTQGFYDEYGFHARRGVIIEGSATNNIIQSSGLTDAAWVASNMTVTSNSVGAPDGNTTAETLTSTAQNATLTQTVTAGSAQYTESIFLKRKTGTGPIYISGDNGTTLYACNVLDTVNWVRCQTFKTTTNPTLQIIIANKGDAVYAWGGQLETGAWASTYIPTTTTALTRGAEVLKYATSGNLTAAGQSIFIKMTPFWGGNDTSTNLTAFDTDTKRQIINLSTSADSFQFYPNFTDSSGSLQVGVGNIDRNKTIIAAGSYTAATPSSAVYVNGFQDASDTSTAITAPAYGTSFYIGSTSTPNAQINAIIEEVRVYNTELTKAQVFNVEQDMGLRKKTHILAVGDSISSSNGSGTISGNWSYRRELQYQLGDKYLMVGNKSSPTYDQFPNYFYPLSTRNAAVSGETSTQILARIPANISSYFVAGTYNKGSAVLIHAGTNDITLDPQSNLALSITAAITNIKSMIDLFDAADPEINIYVCKIIPRYDTSANIWYTQRFNEELARTRLTWSKKNVYIVDMQGAFKADSNWKTDYMYDSKHPNDAGFNVMGKVYAAAVKDAVTQNIFTRNSFSAYAAGTVYSLTNASALVDFGTTDPTIQIDLPGRYIVSGGVQLKYNAATFVANQTATCKITRLNNTAADLTGATRTTDLRIITTITDNAGYVQIPATYYDTVNTNDVLAVYCGLSAAPGAGSVDATSAEITATRLY